MTLTFDTTFEATVQHFVRFTDPELDLEDVCLEVHAGQAEASRAIARRVRHVTALDSKADQLAEGKSQADRLGIPNVTFQVGDAADLPYLDRTFTLVLCRDALGTAKDAAAVVRELVRVSRPGAGIVVSDPTMTADEIGALLVTAGADVKRTDHALGRAFVAAAAP